MSFDWQQFHADNTTLRAVVDPQRRLRICLAVFAVLLLVVFGRAVQLEVTEGAGFRAAALRPIERETVLPAARGRILARDGTVLAYDRAVQAVAVEYRWLEEPADNGWLLARARAGCRERTAKMPNGWPPLKVKSWRSATNWLGGWPPCADFHRTNGTFGRSGYNSA